MSSINIITKLLLAAAPVTTIVGTRVYPIFLPQAATLPAIRSNLVHEDDPNTLGGRSKLVRGRVQVECITAGSGLPTLFTLAEAAKDAILDKINVSIAGCINVTTGKADTDITDESELSANGQTPDTIRRIMDFYVWWRKAP